MPKLANGLTLLEELVYAVEGSGEDPQKEAEQNDDPEMDVGALEGGKVEVQLDAHRLLQRLEIFDDEDDTQKDDQGGDDYFNETHV